jgi:hypothetical protein
MHWIIALYNRAKAADAAYSLINWALWGLSGLAAWMSSTWAWYWTTFSWAGIAIAFLVSWIVLTLGFFLSGLAVRAWRGLDIKPSRSPTAATNSFVRDAEIRSRMVPPATIPRFVATFIRSGKKARLFVEDRYYVPSIGIGGLAHTPQILLDEITDFIVGTTMDIQLFVQRESDGRRIWQWGPRPTNLQDAKTYFPIGASHQGRLVLVCDDEPHEYFYFISEWAPNDGMPNLIGRERFNFAERW